jgi:hypothetical protein
MSHATNFAENSIIDFIRGAAMPLPESGWWVGLLSGFDSDESFIEFGPTTDYSRQVLARSLDDWSGTQGPGSTLASTGTSHATSTNIGLDFGVGLEGTATHFGIFDAESGGNLWWAVPLSSPLVIGISDPVSFGPGEIAISVGFTGGLSDYASNKLIDLIFRGQAWTWPNPMYVGYCTTTPTNAAPGTEPLGGYARVALASTFAALAGTQGDGTTDASDGESGRTSNNADIVFPTPTANQGDVGHSITMDAATVGNMLVHMPLKSGGVETVFSVNQGSGAPRFEAGRWGITVR